jgi:hypothetical protein
MLLKGNGEMCVCKKNKMQGYYFMKMKKIYKKNCVPLNIGVIENLAKTHTFARTPLVTSNVWTKNEINK